MKLKVLIPFRDRDDYSKAYAIGDTISVPRDRGERIVSLGLAEEIKDCPESKTVTTQPVAAPPKPEPATAESEPEPIRRKGRRPKETETPTLL